MERDLRSEFIRLLKEDERFRYEVLGLLGLREIVDELRKLRRDFNRYIKLSEERWKKNEERWEENDKRWELNAKLWEEKKPNLILLWVLIIRVANMLHLAEYTMTN
jgi:hypothetical protein